MQLRPCPRCGWAESYQLTSRDTRKCKRCWYQFSDTSGTLWHSPKIEAKRRQQIIDLLNEGMRPYKVSQLLGMQYKTIWNIKAKLDMARLGLQGQESKMVNHPHRKKAGRTSANLRDLLFDEIEELQSGNGDPQKSMAVANLARQIVNTAKVEIDFHRQVVELSEKGSPLKMGTLQLGASAASAVRDATDH